MPSRRAPSWSTCVVWCWQGATTPEAASAVLNSAETERAAAHEAPADRVRSATAAGLLRLAAASFVLGGLQMYDVPVLARALEVDRTCPTCDAQHGRAVVGVRRLHTSVAHAGRGDESAVVVAVTSAGPVGVDAEFLGGRAAAVRSSILAADEVAPQSSRDWCLTWCRKQAVLKATRDCGCPERPGTPMSDVALAPGGSAVASYAGEALDCELHDLDLADGLTGAVAVLNAQEPVALRLADAAELLG